MTFLQLAAEIARLAHDAEIELFDLDLTPLGDTIRRFHAGTNQLGGAVVWQGNEYTPAPVEADGFAWDGQGQRPTPTFRVANVSGLWSELIINHEQLLGAQVTRRRTLTGC